jgi:SAM-dependent methyltransferase
VASRLGQAGHEVVGISQNREMMSLARERCRPYDQLVRLQHHDLRRQPLAERFHVLLVSLYTFNYMIDVEEQRLFLRHARRTLHHPGVLVIDCFCPLSLVCPDQVGTWRTIERTAEGHHVGVRDRREMLNPLLERRTQIFQIDGGPEHEMVTHRRYLPPMYAVQLLVESGFENVRWIQNYDSTTVGPIRPEDRPTGPFLVIADV